MMEAKFAIIPAPLDVSKDEGAALAPSSNINRILFIRGGAVGDFVLTVPLLRALRKMHPLAGLDILGYPETASLAVACGLAGRVHRVDSPAVAPLFSDAGSFSEPQAAWFAEFDVVVCVWPDRDSVMSRRLGQVCRGRLLQIDPFPGQRSGVHAVDHANAQFVAQGGDAPEPTPVLFPGAAESLWAEELWRRRGWGGERVLAVHPGSGSARKNWPADRFASVLNHWVSKGGRGLLTAGPADDAAVDRMLSCLSREAVFCLRNEPLPKVAAALARCAACLGNDSGLSHLGAALGTPTVAVFGPTDSALWAPRGRRMAVVEGGAGFARAPVAGVIRALESVTG